MSLDRDTAQKNAEYRRGLLPRSELDRHLLRLGREDETAAGEVRTRIPRARMFRKRSNMVPVAAARAREVAEGLRAKGIPVVVQEHGGRTFLAVDPTVVLMEAAGGVEAPVARDKEGNEVEIVGRVDHGPARHVSDEEGRRVPSFEEPVWEILRPSLGETLTLERAREIEADDFCVDCRRHEGKGYRRRKTIVRWSDGRIGWLGATCARKLFGCTLAELWPREALQREAGRILKWYVDRARSEAAALHRGRLHGEAVSRLNQALTGDLTYDILVEELEADITAKNVRDDYLLNTLNQLRRDPERFLDRQSSQRRGDGTYLYDPRLNNWGRSLIRYHERRGRPRVRRQVTGTRPDVAVGDRGAFEGRVVSVTEKEGSYGFYTSVVVERSDGWRLWLSSQDEAFAPGARVSFTARVNEHRDGITFLRRAGRIERLENPPAADDTEQDEAA